jgi:hypothetical protein
LGEGYQCFQMMKDEYHIVPTVEPYGLPVHVGLAWPCWMHTRVLPNDQAQEGIHESYQTIKHRKAIEMQMHAGIWGALLRACRTYSECGDCGGLNKAPSQAGAR